MAISYVSILCCVKGLELISEQLEMAKMLAKNCKEKSLEEASPLTEESEMKI